jgi:two-component system chemotaxis response regulator CheB
MTGKDLIVIGGSAGALEPLKAIVELLPPSLDASVLIVMHTRARADGGLPDVLQHATEMPVRFARNGDAIAHGHIYVAPPDWHLLVTTSGLQVVQGPRENGFRPAIDPLFRTAARAFGPRVIGVILSGALSDGTYGLSVIKARGGSAIVQDPDDATIPHLPRSAIASVDVDSVAPASEIPAIIERLAREPAREGDNAMAPPHALEPQLPSEDTSVSRTEKAFGPPSSLTCPDCGGALWEVGDDRTVRYQCHVGHQYAPDVLEIEHRNSVDRALWSAVRVLEEHAELKARMAQRSASEGLTVVTSGFERDAQDAHAEARLIRSVLLDGGRSRHAVEHQRHPAARRKAGGRKFGHAKRRD